MKEKPSPIRAKRQTRVDPQENFETLQFSEDYLNAMN